MAHDFRSYNPDQPHLLPSDPKEWLSEDHLAYLIRELVEELDLSALEASYSSDGRGAPAFAPKLMVSLLLYSWCSGVFSSRRIARLCTDDLGGRYLAGGHRPDFRSVNEFRLRHGEALSGLFVQSLQLCQRIGMVSLGHVALDGSKIAANASKHKAMSYGRMTEDEARLEKEVAALEQTVEGLVKQASEVNAAEDARLGGSPSPLSEELSRRQSRLSKVREAKAALEAEATAAARVKQAEREAEDRARAAAGEPKKKGKKPNDPDTVVPKEKAQRNFTDPESRIMKSGNGSWVQGYNGQAAVDADHQVIVACELTNRAADVGHLEGLIDQVGENTGGLPAVASADAGYFSTDNVEFLESRSIRPMIPPDRQRHGAPSDPGEPISEEALSRLSLTERQRHRVSTASGRAEYAKRKITVEPTFGQIKGCPAAPGFLGFLRRGLQKCQQEWSWVCAAHNFKKYLRFQLAQRQVTQRQVSAPASR